MLIDETRPLATSHDAWDSEVLERELTGGVVVVEQGPLVHQDRVETLLGGLITAEGHVLVLVREAD